MKKIAKSLSFATCLALSLSAANAEQNLPSPEKVEQKASTNKDGLKKFLEFFKKLSVEENVIDIAGDLASQIDLAANLYIPASSYVGALNGVFDTITNGVQSAVQGHVIFDIQSIPVRIKSAILLTKIIAKAATPYELVSDENGNIIQRLPVEGSLYLKPQQALTGFGFVTAGIITSVLNPLTELQTLEENMQRLQDVYRQALNAPDITGNDIANSNIRQELANVLIKSRWALDKNAFRWHNVPADQAMLYSDLRSKLNAALPVRLGLKESVHEVTDLRNEINADLLAFNEAVKNNAEYIRAKAGDREPLAKELRKYRWYLITKLKYKSQAAKDEFQSAIREAFKVRMNWDSTIADIQKSMEDLSLAYEKINSLSMDSNSEDYKDKIVALQKQGIKAKAKQRFLVKMKIQRAINASNKALKWHRYEANKLKIAYEELQNALSDYIK